MTMVALMMMMTQPQRLSGDQCCDSMRFVLLQSLEDNPVVRLLSTIYYLLAADSTQPGTAQKLRKSSSFKYFSIHNILFLVRQQPNQFVVSRPVISL